MALQAWHVSQVRKRQQSEASQLAVQQQARDAAAAQEAERRREAEAQVEAARAALAEAEEHRKQEAERFRERERADEEAAEKAEVEKAAAEKAAAEREAAEMRAAKEQFRERERAEHEAAAAKAAEEADNACPRYRLNLEAANPGECVYTLAEGPTHSAARVAPLRFRPSLSHAHAARVLQVRVRPTEGRTLGSRSGEHHPARLPFAPPRSRSGRQRGGERGRGDAGVHRVRVRRLPDEPRGRRARCVRVRRAQGRPLGRGPLSRAAALSAPLSCGRRLCRRRPLRHGTRLAWGRGFAPRLASRLHLAPRLAITRFLEEGSAEECCPCTAFKLNLTAASPGECVCGEPKVRTTLPRAMTRAAPTCAAAVCLVAGELPWPMP